MILIDLRKRLFLLVSGRGKYAPDFPYHGCALPTELGQASISSLEASDAGVDAAGRAPRWPGCSVVMPSRRMQSDHTAVTNPRRLGLAWRVQQEAVKAVGRNEAASSGSSTVNSPASAPRMLNRGEAAWPVGVVCPRRPRRRDQQVVQALVGPVKVIHLAQDDRSCRVCSSRPGGSPRRSD